MSRFIAIANQKGGVGKTTTTVNLAASLARFGQRVLVLDMDPQGNASSGFGVAANAHHRGVYEVLMGAMSIQEAVTPQASPGVDLLPSGQRLIGAEVELVSALARERILEKSIQPIRDTYDILLADCPPSLGLLTVNTLTAADSVLIPMQCEYYALEGLTQLLNTIKLIQQALNSRLEIEGILLTMFDARLNLSHEVADETRKFFPGRVYETVIPRNVRLSEAPSFGKPVIEYDPECAGAQFYLKLAREVLNLPTDAEPLVPGDAEPEEGGSELGDAEQVPAAEMVSVPVADVSMMEAKAGAVTHQSVSDHEGISIAAETVIDEAPISLPVVAEPGLREAQDALPDADSWDSDEEAASVSCPDSPDAISAPAVNDSDRTISSFVSSEPAVDAQLVQVPGGEEPFVAGEVVAAPIENDPDSASTDNDPISSPIENEAASPPTDNQPISASIDHDPISTPIENEAASLPTDNEPVPYSERPASQWGVVSDEYAAYIEATKPRDPLPTPEFSRQPFDSLSVLDPSPNEGALLSGNGNGAVVTERHESEPDAGFIAVTPIEPRADISLTDAPADGITPAGFVEVMALSAADLAEDVLTLPEESIVLTEVTEVVVADGSPGNRHEPPDNDHDPPGNGHEPSLVPAASPGGGFENSGDGNDPASNDTDLQPMTSSDDHHPQEELVSHD